MNNSPAAGATKRPAINRYAKLVWIVPVIVVALAVVVFGAMALRSSSAGASFIADYPGHSELPDDAPVGFPAWLAWQHFLNSFFILLIIRSGWQVRTTTRPFAYWSPRRARSSRSSGAPMRISVTLWFHLAVDILWLANGIVFFVLLFTTGQWVRLVPTSWDVIPNAVSAAIQYASLHWPTENGWVNYNALQLITYFLTVFVAAPLAFLSGIRMSPVWPKNNQRLAAIYPVGIARAVHLPVMFYFVAFVIVHVTLVLATGALRNLNHMYGGSDRVNWVGFGIFAASLVVMAAAVVAARPMVLRWLASLTGSISR